MKSDSVSAPPVPKWRLTRTLRRRNVGYRPIEDADIKYAWAAFKHGALADVGLPDAEIAPAEFKSKFEQWVLEHCHAAWTLLAGKPIGLVLGGWAPSGGYMIIGAFVFMPWASKRTIIEATVNFVSEIRKEYPFMGYALPHHKRLYEVVARHGVMRRVGTSQIAIPGERCAVFETVTPEKAE